jgi:hypothetical protein
MWGILVETLREHFKGQLEMRMALGLGRLPDETRAGGRSSGSPTWGCDPNHTVSNN